MNDLWEFIKILLGESDEQRRHRHHKKHKVAHINVLFWKPVPTKFKGKRHMTNSVSLHTDDNQVVATAVFTDKKGNPTTPAGVPVWSVGDAAVAAVAAAADGLTAVVTPVGVGTTSVAVSVDGVSGSGAVAVVAAGVGAVAVDFGAVS